MSLLTTTAQFVIDSNHYKGAVLEHHRQPPRCHSRTALVITRLKFVAPLQITRAQFGSKAAHRTVAMALFRRIYNNHSDGREHYWLSPRHHSGASLINTNPQFGSGLSNMQCINRGRHRVLHHAQFGGALVHVSATFGQCR